jgi:hypothetical protein
VKRALVLVALVLAVVAPPPAPVTPEPVAQCTSCDPTSAAPAATVASLPEVVDDPCLPGDPTCSAPAPETRDRLDPTPVHPAAVGQDAGEALPPAGGVIVATPQTSTPSWDTRGEPVPEGWVPATDSPMCAPDLGIVSDCWTP